MSVGRRPNRSERMPASIGPITAPTLYVWGNRDPYISRTAADLCGRYVTGRYRYEVTVHYRNGKFKKVVTYSNTPGTPRVLVEVIRKVETMPAPSFPPGFPFN